MGFDTQLTVNTDIGNNFHLVDPANLKNNFTDLDTLLSDISDITQADSSIQQTTPVPNTSMDTASLRMLDFQGPFQDEVTFYDDPLPVIKKEKMDLTFNNVQSEQKEMLQQDLSYDPDLEKVCREIEYACVLLDIPAGE